VILVAVVAGVCEDDVRPELSCELSERIFNLCELGGEISIPECMHADGTRSRGAQEASSPSVSLELTLAVSAPHHPAKVWSRLARCKREQRCAAADLNVIGVSA
jgi:hypothetical protein